MWQAFISYHLDVAPCDPRGSEADLCDLLVAFDHPDSDHTVPVDSWNVVYHHIVRPKVGDHQGRGVDRLYEYRQDTVVHHLCDDP